MARPNLERAKANYTQRFTMEHVPQWALKPAPNGLYYLPQYASDKEWYDLTLFPGEAGHIGPKTHCYSTRPTWPLGEGFGTQPFRVRQRA